MVGVVSQLRGQLVAQQQWLPTITAFKMFQTISFGEFLISCLDSFKTGVVTKTLDDVMTSNPGLDFWSHELYDPAIVVSADDDLMRVVLALPHFPFLEDLRKAGRLRTFEEMLASTVDEDMDYYRHLEQGLKSSLHLESLGLSLMGQLVGVLADLMVELEESSREAFRGLHPMEDEEELDAEAALEPDLLPEEGGRPKGTDGEVLGVVHETLTEVLVDAEPSFAAEAAVKTTP